MSWARIDDKFHSHRKIVEAGNEAAGLFVRLVAWSADHLTDGAVPRSVAGFYSSGKDDPISSLVQVGLLHETADGNYLLHDYLKYNPSKGDVDDRRSLRSKAGKVGGEKSRKQNVSKSQANGKQNVSKTKAKRNPVPDPDPVITHIGKSDLQNLESNWFNPWGAIGTKARPLLRQLMPIHDWELDDIKAEHPDKPWVYVAKVLKSNREQFDFTDSQVVSAPETKPVRLTDNEKGAAMFLEAMREQEANGE